MFIFYVDGDACPVKEIIKKVVDRYQLETIIVSASPLKVKPPIKNVAVGNAFDGADDWIIERIQKFDLLATADIELAYRALKADAYAIDFKGTIFTDENIVDMMAKRNLMAVLRDTQFDHEKKLKKRTLKDSSVFANNLDNIIQKIKRKLKI
ncbi:MAG: hypothetical protein COA79_00100 [Planctomycetota bacterium]|nr:MAG: hypothetical protein COA79_00100 [Planctomycetota bacterium]